MDAIVLAGGRGTRLRSVVSDRPKPMAEVAGRPFLEWLLLALRARGLRRVILATGYLGEMIEAFFGAGAAWGLQLVFSRETAPLGTGGAVRFALEHVRGDQVLVLNGDSYCPFDLAQLATHHARAAAMATMWVAAMEDCQRYGSVILDPQGRVTAFQEKPSEPRPGLINAGIYLCERQLLESIPAGRVVSLETDVFPHLVGQGLYGVSGAGPFLDICTPETYTRAEQFLRESKLL